MISPYTEIIIKTKGVYEGDIWYIHHPIDLRDKLKYKTNPIMSYRSINRSDYHLLTQDSSSLFNYEE